jgi:hypothetical protein
MIKFILAYLLLAALIPLPDHREIKSCHYVRSQPEDKQTQHIPDYLSISLKMAMLKKQTRTEKEGKPLVACERHELKKILTMRINPLSRWTKSTKVSTPENSLKAAH